MTNKLNEWISDAIPCVNDITTHCEVLVVFNNGMYSVACFDDGSNLFFVNGKGLQLIKDIAAWSKIEEFE